MNHKINYVLRVRAILYLATCIRVPSLEARITRRKQTERPMTEVEPALVALLQISYKDY